MDVFIEGAGVFVYPLGLCSLIAVFVIAERLLALRRKRVMPPQIAEALLRGKDADIPSEGDSAAARMVRFFQEKNPDAETLKAYERLEFNRLERGVFLLDMVIAAAPLLGLLGTVAGLVQVFSANMTPEGLPESETFVKGVSLALITTVMGLSIAIPTLVFHGIIVRRIDILCAQLDLMAERLLSLRRAGKDAPR